MKSKQMMGIVLLVACAAMWVPLQGEVLPPVEAPDGQPSDDLIRSCWRTLEAEKDCLEEVANLTVTLIPHMGPACCKTLKELPKACMPKMFDGFDFINFNQTSAILADIVEHFCA